MDWTTVMAVSAWLVSNWSDILTFALASVAIVQAVQQSQYQRLLPLAGALAYDVAKLADLDNDGKRKQVADAIKGSSFLAKFLTPAQVDSLVETGWHFIAKPQVESEKQ